MSLFDKLKQAAGELAEGASRQARMLRLQSELGQVEAEIERNYIEAGKQVHQLHRRGQVNDSEIALIVERVEKLQERQEQLRQQVQRLRAEASKESEESDARTNEGTEEKSAADASGEQAGKTEAPVDDRARPDEPSESGADTQKDGSGSAPPPQQALCPECGSRIPASSRFCSQCGCRLDDDD